MPRRNYSGKRDFKTKEGLVIEQKRFEAGSPTKEKVSTGSEMLDYVAFRDLAFKGAIEPYADPNTEAARGSYPYAILNKTNRVVEAKYPGYKNLTGNSIVRLQNSVSSKFLNFFDSVIMKKRLNYLYLAYTSTDKNVATNIEMLKAFEQALSYGYSTMLTQLPFYVDYTVSGLPRGTATPLTGHENDNYDKMGALLHYQTVLQNVVSPLAKYVELLSLEEDLMNMSYRREAPLVQQIFGQLKKKAFVAQLNSIGTVVLGEYFDTNWWKQMNALRHIPSRKANDMNHPLITMATSTVIPSLQLYATTTKTGTPYYDSDTVLKYKAPTDTLLDPETFKKYAEASAGAGVTLTLEQIIYNINKLMDAHYMLAWCRKANSGILPSGAIQNASDYYQAIVLYINCLSRIASSFGSHMTEVRTFLDKMSDTGMVYWKKGIMFDIARIFPKSLTYNQIVADIFKSTVAGADTIYYDNTTQRWICNTEWDMYSGINKFDDYSGGSFLTFSLRNINVTGIGETASQRLLPILFNQTPLFTNWEEASLPTNYSSAGVRIQNRLGATVYVDTYAITASNINSDNVLSRLNPLSDSNLSIKAPGFNSALFDVTQLSANDRAAFISALSKLLLQAAKYHRIGYSTVVVSAADPDLLAFIDLQVEDVSNAMIQFCRNYSPFRVSTMDGERSMGFGAPSSNDVSK